MDDATVFYILGGVLAASAVLFTFVALRVEGFPGRAAPVVFLWFAVVVGAATTFAVLNGQNEQSARAAELQRAGEEVEEAEREAPSSGGEEQLEEAASEEAGGQPQSEAKAGGAPLQLAAEPNEIAFDTTELSAKAGKVTIDFSNPSALQHNVAIEQNGKKLAQSATISEGKTSVAVDLKPGTYTYLCTIPGHAEAGMEGTLTVE